MDVNVSIVIPCLNEAQRLSTLEKGLKEFINAWRHEYEIIIVDDGSTDDTSNKVIQNNFFKMLMNKGVLNLITFKQNKGKGAALKAGVLETNGDFVLTMDADISTHPLEIINWKKKLKGMFDKNAIVIASRTHKHSTLIEKKHRKIIGLIFNYVVRLITGLNIKDSQCGFKLYPREIGKNLFANLHTNGWAHDVEILCRAKQLNIRIIEQPVHWTVKDDSKIRVLGDSLKMFLQILRIRIQILNKPFQPYEKQEEVQEIV